MLSNVARYILVFFGVLQVIFITLKIFNLISWSWWLIFIPAYIYIATIIIAILSVYIKHKDDEF